MAFTNEFDENQKNIPPLPTWGRGDVEMQEQEIPSTPSDSPESVPYFQSESILEPPHLAEWLDSAVNEEIIRLNVKSLEGYTPYDYLLYSPQISRRNDGRLRDYHLNKYRHIEHGGWWCSGIDPLNGWKEMEWGCFKPNCPRNDSKKVNKLIKYEHPLLEPMRVFLLYVPDATWEKVSERCGIPISEEDKQNPHGFWYWVWKNNVPITLSEGAKKAGALLSAGYAAISLPGVNGGYRNPKNEEGRRQEAEGRRGNGFGSGFSPKAGKPFLIPDLQFFCTPGREFYICFDRDSKPETVLKVRTAIYKTARLLVEGGCQVKIIDLPAGGEKGVDDFIAARGKEAFYALYNAAQPLSKWQVNLYTLLTHPPDVALNKRFIGELFVPDHAKLIVIKAAKGTGKTEWLAAEVAKAQERCQKVLVLTHRVQLGEALCSRFGIDYVTELKTSETGGVLGYGLCVDSMHKKSSARFDPWDWSNAVVIVDEADQVFWHLLNSNTEVKKHRVTVLRNLMQLFNNVLSSSEGKIYLSSADVSDVDIKFVCSSVTFDVKPYVIVNEYQPSSGDCYVYEGKDPRMLVAEMIEDIKAGGKSLVCCTAQKAQSHWSTQALEKMLRKRFPGKRILRIDSESVSDPNHAAYGCISRLNQILPLYDIVIVSPCLETGVSIDLTNHFTGVWNIASGVQPENSVRQSLARVRETVPRHVWISQYGLRGCRIGNGSTSIGSLILSQQKTAKVNIQLLTAADHQEDYDFGAIDWGFQRESLNTWAAKACVINAGMARYRETILEGLAADGYNIIPASQRIACQELSHRFKYMLLKHSGLMGLSPLTERHSWMIYLLLLSKESAVEVAQQVKEVRDNLYEEECIAVSKSETYTDSEYIKAKEKRAKTQEERYRERKTKLEKRYDVPVTPDVVEKDDNGWYPQLRLYYYLTIGREFVVPHDARKAKKALEEGEGAVWQPDFNRGQFLGSVRLLEGLGVSTIMEPGKQWKKIDPEVQRTEQLAKQYKYIIKDYLGITISDKDSPIAVVQKLLSKLGCKLQYIARQGSRGNRHMIYEFVPPSDGRDEVLQAWLKQEAMKIGVGVDE